MTKYNSLKNETVTSTPLCVFSGNITYWVIIACTILVIIFVFGLNKRLSNVKVQLDSCRSSMRSD
jgi:hypothetical protein